jgi:hypothetical protein
MDPFNVFAWIIFYFVIVTLFYYCFRQSISSVSSTPPSTASRTAPTTRSGSNNQRSNGRRTTYSSGNGRNVYVITDENDHRPSDASDIRSPPEYKWEDLPPSYEEAVGSFTNPTFDDQQQQPSTSVDGDSTVIELPASAASVN